MGPNPWHGARDGASNMPKLPIMPENQAIVAKMRNRKQVITQSPWLVTRIWYRFWKQGTELHPFIILKLFVINASYPILIFHWDGTYPENGCDFDLSMGTIQSILRVMTQFNYPDKQEWDHFPLVMFL